MILVAFEAGHRVISNFRRKLGAWRRADRRLAPSCPLVYCGATKVAANRKRASSLCIAVAMAVTFHMVVVVHAAITRHIPVAMYLGRSEARSATLMDTPFE